MSSVEIATGIQDQLSQMQVRRLALTVSRDSHGAQVPKAAQQSQKK